MLLYSIILLFAVLLCAGLSVLAWLRRAVPGAKAFFWGSLAGVFYALGSFFEIRAASSQAMFFCLCIEYAGIATIGPLWVLMARSVSTGRDDHEGKLWGSLLTVSALIFAAVCSNNLHHLFYTSISPERHGEFMVPVLGKGPLYYVNLVYMNVCLFLATLYLLSSMMRSHPAFRHQYVFLFAGSMMPWAGMFLYQTGLSPWGLDIAPIGLTGSSLLYAWSLFRYRLFDLTPIMIDQILESMHEGVLVVDPLKRLAGLNAAMETIVPGLKREQIGSSSDSFLEACPELKPVLESAEGLALQMNGRHFQIDRSELRDLRKNLAGTIFLFTDISKQVELSNQLRYLSRTDELTQLPNRRSFLEQLTSGLETFKRHSTALGLIILDIDHFKSINDQFGHQAGDMALKHVAKTCSACLRACDFMARYGGEEFAVLVPHTELSTACTVAERMRKSLQDNPLVHNSRTICITASFGVAVLAHNKQDSSPAPADNGELCMDALVRNADNAMYKAKEKGRNRVESTAPSSC